jgi:hypothetical protein
MWSLVAPMGRRTQSEVETWQHLLVIHFPNSVVTEEVEAPAASRCAKRLDFRVANRDIT